MIKLKTGVSTSLDFVKAMKERGQSVSPAFPAETLREQIEEALPALEEAIIERLGNDSFVRNFDFGLTVEEYEDRSGNPAFTISSNNLVDS